MKVVITKTPPSLFTLIKLLLFFFFLSKAQFTTSETDKF